MADHGAHHALAGAITRQQEFVEAAVSVGLSPAAIIRKHVVPNALGPIIVYTTLTIPRDAAGGVFELPGAGHPATGDLLGLTHQLRGRNHGGISMAADLPGVR